MRNFLWWIVAEDVCIALFLLVSLLVPTLPRIGMKPKKTNLEILRKYSKFQHSTCCFLIKTGLLFLTTLKVNSFLGAIHDQRDVVWRYRRQSIFAPSGLTQACAYVCISWINILDLRVNTYWLVYKAQAYPAFFSCCLWQFYKETLRYYLASHCTL